MRRIEACRSCGDSALIPVLGLGETPLANALVSPERAGEPERRYPLELVFCEGCSLAQITETVPPDVLFRDYVYFSSYSDTMLSHARELAALLLRELRPGPDCLVVEIASNDGYLLRNFVEAGVRVLGIEPARNVAAAAIERGIPTRTEFFGRNLAEALAGDGQRADLILANNVLAHVPDVNDVVAGIGALLKPDGTLVLETPYVADLLERLEFDTIYHEHVFYYSLTALGALFRRHGLRVAGVERIPIHGGSLRVTVRRADRAAPAAAVTELLAEEQRAGLAGGSAYQGFAARVRSWREELREMVSRLRSEGKRLAAYGAAAKGCTLLHYAGLGRETLEFVADRSPHKQGKLTPGTRIPIVGPGALLAEQPDVVLLLTWNFAEEILAQQAEYRRRGGRFLIPIPEPRLV